MGKIFYIMGKSSSGKDTIYNRLRTDETLELSKLILYTTRPMREGEMQGRQYHFVQKERYCRLNEDAKVIESLGDTLPQMTVRLQTMKKIIWELEP